uniref:Alpha/beta hydrolase fold protein n=1 Tax=Sphingobacterium sp. (strain 21) TaxID=743722 RepID=F4C2I2_SPHS2
MPHIQIQNREIHIQELNKDAPQTIVLIHGMFSNLSVYYFRIAPILAKYFHVIMYDLKSHGLSSRVDHGYRFDDMSYDLIDLMDTLMLEKVHLVGYSFGGLVALNTCLKYPSRIDRLGVIEAPDPGDRKTMDIIDIYSKEFLEHYIQNFTDTTKVKMGKRQLEKNHRMYQYLFDHTSIKDDMEKEIAYFSSAPIKSITQNTLLIYGKQSNCLESGKFLAKHIVNAEFVTLLGDHNLPMQAPELIANKLLGFLSKQAVLA